MPGADPPGVSSIPTGIPDWDEAAGPPPGGDRLPHLRPGPASSPKPMTTSPPISTAFEDDRLVASSPFMEDPAAGSPEAGLFPSRSPTSGRPILPDGDAVSEDAAPRGDLPGAGSRRWRDPRGSRAAAAAWAHLPASGRIRDPRTGPDPRGISFFSGYRSNVPEKTSRKAEKRGISRGCPTRRRAGVREFCRPLNCLTRREHGPAAAAGPVLRNLRAHLLGKRGSGTPSAGPPRGEGWSPEPCSRFRGKGDLQIRRFRTGTTRKLRPKQPWSFREGIREACGGKRGTDALLRAGRTCTTKVCAVQALLGATEKEPCQYV